MKFVRDQPKSVDADDSAINMESKPLVSGAVIRVKKRGRPPKKVPVEAEIKAEEAVVTVAPAALPLEEAPLNTVGEVEMAPPQKRRGRPPKKAIIAELEAQMRE